MSESNEHETAEAVPQIDPVQLRYALEKLRSEQNLLPGILAGLVAAIVGAGVWAVVTVTTGYQIGWMAVGVGFAVGFAVRTVGKGIERTFGFAGAVLALLGCGLGNLLAVCAIIAKHEGIAFLDVVSRLDASIARELMAASFSPMDLLFYGIAIYEGYKFSFRRLSARELNTLIPGIQ